jgi:hypothetical protein
MEMKNVIVPIALLLCLLQATSTATTVTLTGTCGSAIINQSSNYLLFNLSNSGSGAATDIILVPNLEGAATSNSSVTIPMLGPGSSYLTRFYLYNFTAPGSYAEHITAEYSQGSSSFMTVFSCLSEITKSAQSLVQILNISRRGSRLNVSVYDLARYPVYANITVAVPPAFSVAPVHSFLSLDPGSRSYAVFNVSAPSYTGASFPITVAVSYTNGSMHYASMGVYVYSFASAPVSSPTGIPATTAITAAAIIILLALITVSIIRRRKPKASQ